MIPREILKPCQCGYPECDRDQLRGSENRNPCSTCGQPMDDHCLTVHLHYQIERLKRQKETR